MAHCTCPPGYTLLDDDITCEKITYANATPPVTGIPIAQNIEDCVWNPIANTLTCTASSFGVYGLVVHENITSNQNGGTKQWPIIENVQNGANTQSLSIIPTTGPNWTSISPPGNFSLGHNGQHIRCNTPNPVTWPLLGLPNIVPSNGCLRESQVLSDVLYYGIAAPVVPTNWLQTVPWINTTPGSGWAYSVAIWPDDQLLTNFKWVGISVCIDVPVDKTYYILMSCNNALRLSVDGQLAVERNVGDGGTASFYYINAFPITLTAGAHTLYLEGFNYSGGGAFGFDVLDITLNQLLAIGTLAQIAPYRVASSLWKRSRAISIIGSGTTVTSVGQFTIHDVGAYIDAPGFPSTAYITNVIDANTVQISESILATTTSGTLYFIWDVSNTAENAWTCPEGFLFGNCNGPECRQIELATCIPDPVPCYLLTSCDESIDPIKVNNDLSVYVGFTVRICQSNIPVSVSSNPPREQTGTRMRPIPNETNSIVGTLTACCSSVDPVYVLNDSFANPTYSGFTFIIPSISADTCWTYSQGGNAGEAVIVDASTAYVYNDCASCTLINPCVILPEIAECTCFNVTLASDCLNSITLVLNEPLTSYADCSQCAPLCYLLISCLDSNDTILTYTDLSAYLNYVVNIEGCPGKCWIVTTSDCTPEAVPVEIIGAFPPTIGPIGDIQSCIYNLSDVNLVSSCLYTVTWLTNDVFHTYSWVSLNSLVDSMQAEGLGEVTLDGDKITVVGIGTYSVLSFIYNKPLCELRPPTRVIEPACIFLPTQVPDCASCLPPVPEVPFNLKNRAVKPGFYTLGCPPKYTLAVNCKFAEVMFSQMAVKRYGITPCCDNEDTNKWLIDKELLDLKVLYDPTLCVSTIERCCPVKCLEVTLQVFRTIACLTPINLVTTIIT